LSKGLQKNKKLTLKLLQQELNELKIKTIANNKLPTAAQALVISKKGINKPKASMSLNPLGILMSLSWIVFLLSKFPF
jgi:hypothetical protein